MLYRKTVPSVVRCLGNTGLNQDKHNCFAAEVLRVLNESSRGGHGKLHF